MQKKTKNVRGPKLLDSMSEFFNGQKDFRAEESIFAYKFRALSMANSIVSPQKLTMKSSAPSVLILIFVVTLFAVQCAGLKDPADFFYFVQEWPGSTCGTKQGCCYPKAAGKPPSNFIVHGLWPYTNLGSSVLNCAPKNHLVPSKISNLKIALQKNWPSLTCPSNDGTKLWSNEWKKYGTCSAAVPNQNQYFKAAIAINEKVNMLKILSNAGIRPNGKFYKTTDIGEAILKATGHMPGYACNVDKSGHSQIHLVVICVTGLTKPEIMECPGMISVGGSCASMVKFPSF